MSDIVERLRVPLDREENMRHWDRWRKMHKEGFGGSLTRDEFTSFIGIADEEREEAADEIARLRAELAEEHGWRRSLEAAARSMRERIKTEYIAGGRDWMARVDALPLIEEPKP